MSEVVTGWRYWKAGRKIKLGTPPRAVLVSPLRTYGQGEDEFMTEPEEMVAQCRHRDHAAPAEECSCGVRVMTNLAHLCRTVWAIGYALQTHSDAARFGVVHHLPAAIVMVEGTGRIAGPTWDDPPSTVRVERLRMVGPLLLSPEASRWTSDFERAFGGVGVVPTEVGRHLPLWLNEVAGQQLDTGPEFEEFNAYLRRAYVERQGRQLATKATGAAT